MSRCVVFDVETTGLSPQRGDRIIEIGALAVDGEEIAGEFHSLMDPGRRIPRGVQRIHGITNDKPLAHIAADGRTHLPKDHLGEAPRVPRSLPSRTGERKQGP